MGEPHLFPWNDVAERIREAEHLLVGLDYDGTLTPIVDEPRHALLPATMRQAIWALTRRADTTVAVISGRAQADLQGLVAIPELIYSGNHGMEISGPGISYLEPNSKEAAPRLHLLGQEIAKKLQHIHGVLVEDKGLTLSIHYRRVAPVDLDEVARIVRNAVKSVNDAFHVTLGDKVYEIRPISNWNKGTAIQWIDAKLNRSSSLVVYIGDDATDEDAFQLLNGDAITIRVGARTPTAAQHVLASPSMVLEFLQWLEILREESASLARQ